ncbi:nucleoside recognition family protein [Paramagnetospirillum marisnigri]|uniref:Nucleoside recognition family protein n=1 Tax=Paramagnetospirillum marisnigri TaxID=1285242 RepID=A0A178M3Z1_9PROT|nr:nucleoside recognition domain-containing protein [Paramagnetospirillum marisnigri]OAN42952.1 nucleoside recognition family protein [Paramagnetospirillum marisnigri]
MDFLGQIILPAGRSAIELSLFVLLPVMVVMLAIMRLLEAWGVLDWLVARLAPALRPFGLTGLGVFAALQVALVNFAAPVATLTVMEQRGVSDRHIAAAFAMVLAMAQANVVFPLAVMGLHAGTVTAVSLAGGLTAAAAAYYLFGRKLSAEEHVSDETLHHASAETPKGVLDVINRAGAEAFRIAIGAIPLLVLSLVAVTGLRQAGAVTILTEALRPALDALGIDPILVLPTFTKFLAGGTAMLGIVDQPLRQGTLSPALLNTAAGFLIHPLDMPALAILMSAGRRVAAVWKQAVLGSLVGIALRGTIHLLLG